MNIVIMKLHEKDLKEGVTNHVNKPLKIKDNGGCFHNYHRFFFEKDITDDELTAFSLAHPNGFITVLNGERRLTLLGGKPINDGRRVPPPQFAQYLDDLYKKVSGKQPTT